MAAGHSYDGRTRLVWLDANPADLDSPTMAEITAGTDLSAYLIPDTFNPGTGNSMVDTRSALSSFDSQGIGRYQASPSAMFKSKLVAGGTVAWDTVGERGLDGCLVFFEDVPEGDAIAAAMTCDVYPSAQTGQPERQQTALNTERRFKQVFAIGDAPVLGAAVAA